MSDDSNVCVKMLVDDKVCSASLLHLGVNLVIVYKSSLVIAMFWQMIRLFGKLGFNNVNGNCMQ